MKTNYFSILALALMLGFSGAAYSSQPEERPTDKGQSGNGGGGITRNGRHMTFYSAGFYTEPLEATSDEVPQLANLIQFFSTTQYMSELTKVKYASTIMPSSTRKYYKVQASTFTPEVRSRLLAEYGRVMKVNVNEIALFAITDTESKTTYLLPEYYSLKPTEQQAILFHENFWLLNPKTTYSKVIDAEMSFQAFLENQNSADRLLRWLKTSGTPGDTLLASLKSDLKNQTLNGFVKNDRIQILDLLGVDFINCKARQIGSDCTPFISTHVYRISQKYPNSLFIRIYSESVNSNQLIIQADHHLLVPSYQILVTTILK